MEMCVPTMGDSITEGTIVEWTAQVGQLVKEGDIVALIETDKVTVDIKAEFDGVVVAQFGAVDDNIEVGADLLSIDTEATESCGGQWEVAAADDEDAAVEAPEVDIASGKASGTRVPSIAFLGKAGWTKKLTPSAHSPEADKALGIPPSVGGPAPVTVESTHLGAMYGRIPFSEMEMEALISGGADEAPQLISSSSGAVFGQ